MPPADVRKAAAEATYAASVQRVEDDAGPLRALHGEINVGTERVAAQAVNSIRNDEHFAARTRDRPAGNQIHDR